MRHGLCLILALLGWSQASGQGVSSLYPKAKLDADAARYGEQIRAEYRETILPQLTEAERAALSEVKIEVPAVGRRGDPFEFYRSENTVYLPALSLRFFADLCLANAWLNAHGYDGTTVRDYVGLFFREATVSPSAPLHPIFESLGIPANARDETAVSNRVDRNFGNTVVFLLAHELGHVLKKHRNDAGDPALQRKQEIEADQFAIDVMRRIGQIPLGLEFWFDLERIRYQAPREIPSDSEWQKYLSGLDHPVTTERLNALADAIEKAPDSFARNQTNQALWTARSGMFAQYFRQAAPFAGNSVARVAEYPACAICAGALSNRAKPPLPSREATGRTRNSRVFSVSSVRSQAASPGMNSISSFCAVATKPWAIIRARMWRVRSKEKFPKAYYALSGAKEPFKAAAKLKAGAGRSAAHGERVKPRRARANSALCGKSERTPRGRFSSIRLAACQFD